MDQEHRLAFPTVEEGDFEAVADKGLRHVSTEGGTGAAAPERP